MTKKIDPRFPEYEWYCVACHECLSDQAGFVDNKFTWKCTHCNYKNSISKDNLRKPYAYLKNPSAKNKTVSFILGLIRSIYGFLFRSAFYSSVAALLVLGAHFTTIEHLKIGTISPRDINDYFCMVLYYSCFIVVILLVIYALVRRLFGKPNTKKHFIRETFYFVRDNLLYPFKLIKSLFKKTTILDTILSILALLLLIFTIIALAYGCLHLL